jgi:dTDP-4-dehydrorhamnose reductase
MRRLAATDQTVDMVADQTGSPTYVSDLVEALLQIAAGGIEAPTLHAANAGAASRFDQARAVFSLLRADPERVRPVSTDAVPRPARRPVYSALGMAESARAGLTALRPWREALVAALAVPVADGQITSQP